MFNEIFKEVQESFIVNMGSDGGKKGIYNYKTDTFHVEIKSVDLFDVKINKNKQPIKDNSIKININDFRMLVNPCSSYFIINHCKAKCCQYNAYKLKHPLIMPFDDEIKVFEKVDCKYDDEYKIIRLKENICSFQERPSGFCKLHNTEFKPFGCKIMPLRLVKNEIRVASFLKSYNCQKQQFTGIDKVPFYKGFNQSLIALFGEKETERIINQIELGKVDITVNIHPSNIEKLFEINRIIKKLSKEQK
jgi:hypothetical protein